jgi:outer membrane protein assembly factor BamD (BamD/ComL family)
MSRNRAGRPKAGFFVVLLLCLFFAHKAYAWTDKQLYVRAMKYVQAGDTDFAFLDLCKILERYPKSKYVQQALFAAGEYYFLLADYMDAARSFERFIDDYPQSEARPFALAYLFKIAVIEQKIDLIKELEIEIATSKQLSFLFRDFKEHRYLSPFSRQYKALYFIDRIEFYINDELFTKVFY